MADLILPEPKHPPAVEFPQLEGIMASLEGLAEILRHQAGVIDEITDVGNADLPGFIANGTTNTMVWVAQQIDKIRESLDRKVAQDAQPKPSPTVVM